MITHTTNDGSAVIIYRKKTEFAPDDIISLEYLCEEHPDLLKKSVLIDKDKPLGHSYPLLSMKESWILSVMFGSYPPRLSDVKKIKLPVEAAKEVVYASKDFDDSKEDVMYIYEHKTRDMYCIVNGRNNGVSETRHLICCFGTEAVPIDDLEQEAIEAFKDTLVKKLIEISAQVDSTLKCLREDKYCITKAEAVLPYVGGL